ncbi:hypothetical protein ACT048_20730 [Ectopseudomonas khazarica]|uniref:hypothetical protein n=1 Tax=Ectopseudomonas khazarica TaxID=2502979 RepID=UPI004034576F
MKIALTGFRGEIPILEARLLPEQNAQVARNLTLKHGTLKPERGMGVVAGVPSMINPSSLFHYPNGNNGAGFWFLWGNGKAVHAVKSPLADDVWKRVYWSGDGPPKMGALDFVTAGSGPHPSAYLRLGLPAPATAPGVTAAGDRPGSADWPLTAVQTAYVVTFVSRYGEEGPPSEPSATITRWDEADGNPAGGGVLVGLPGIVAGAYDIASKRLYRVESGSFMLVAEVPAATDQYSDSVPSANLGVALESAEWDMPDDRLRGMTAMPGGFLAGYFDNTLCFSEAYRPHAWPVSYQLAFTDQVMGVVATGSGLVVATKGRPHLVTGSTPAAMASMMLDVDQPCVSAASLVDMGEYAIYASPAGLVAVGGSSAEVVSAAMMSREQWQALNPSTIHAYRHDGRYLAFYSGGCFAFSAQSGFEFYDLSATGGYYDLLNDRLCLISAGAVRGWGIGSAMPMVWRSKINEFPPGGSFSCAKVIARSYPVTFRLFADGQPVCAVEVASGQMFRLPAGFSGAREWEVEMAGVREVISVQIASSPSELI